MSRESYWEPGGGAESVKEKQNRETHAAEDSLKIDEDKEASVGAGLAGRFVGSGGRCRRGCSRPRDRAAAYQQQRELAKADLASASTPGARPAVKRQTVLGVDRLKLMATVSRLPQPQIHNKTGNFRMATARKLAEKKASGTWCGWSQEVPQPRLGGAAAVEAAIQAVR